MKTIALVLLAGAALAQDPQALILTLPEAEALAVKQHPQIAGARLNTLASGQVTTEVRSFLFPTLSGNATAVGTITGSRLAAGFLTAGNLLDRFATGVQVQQLISDFGRTNRLVEASRLHEQSQAASETYVRAQVLLDVDRAYFRTLRALAVLQVANDTVKDRQLVVDQVTELAKSNLRSQLDVSFAGVNLGEAKLLAATAQNEVDESYADLSQALGFGQPRKFNLAPATIADQPETDAAALVAEALAKRPDLASFRFDRDSALRFADAERALSRPTVSALGVVGVIPGHDERLQGNYGAAAVNVSIPIFNGGLFSARRNEAELRAQATVERLRDAEYRVGRDVNTAWLSASTAFQRIGLTAQLLDQAKLALELAQARYNLGLSSIIELSQAQLNQTGAEIQTLTARYDFQIQSAVLKYQLGRLQ
jgi:outer membrane protein